MPLSRIGNPGRRPGRPQGQFTQHRRMSELRQLLHQYPRGLTLAEISEQLGVTTRSARRYLRELRLDLEAVLERYRAGERVTLTLVRGAGYDGAGGRSLELETELQTAESRGTEEQRRAP